MPLDLTVMPDDSGRRLDRVLRKALRNRPLSAIHRMLRKGEVKIDGKTAGPEYRVSAGQIIKIKKGIEQKQRKTESEPVENELPKKPQLEIIFEGEGLLIINKPSGLPVHGMGRSGKQSLDDLVRSYLKPKLSPSLSFRPGPLHRLDLQRSGLIAFSTNLEGARAFSSLLRERKIKKYYLALVKGEIKESEIWQDELVRDRGMKKTFNAVDQEGQSAVSKTALTRVSPVYGNGSSTLILAEIETGRTHQIRAQAAVRGHPLLGDKKYSGNFLSGGFLLHAWRMKIPAEKESVTPQIIEAPLPEYFERTLREKFGEEAFNIILQVCSTFRD
jgi:23S rRNA pseudouridine955/2504/2580 synthase